MGYSPWGGKELDMTGQLSAHTHKVVCILTPRTCACVLYMEKETLGAFLKILTYLAASSLSWGMRDLPSSLWCAQSFSWSL